MRHRLALTAIALATMAAPPAHAEMRAGDITGWGDAWGDDTVSVPTAPARRAETPPAAVPVQVQAVAPTVAPKAPVPSEIGGWGDAWNGDAAPVSPPRAVPVAADAPAAAMPQVQPTPAQAVQAEAKATAGDSDEEKPINLTADQIIHDRDLGIVTATGRVEVIQGGWTLTADTVNYNLKQDIVSASGKVTVLQPDGTVLFADHFELTGDFKEGVAEQIRVLLADRSRMAAATAHRVGGDRTDFEDGSYTACEPCRDNPNARPLWEAKAKRITHNQADKTIEYRDAWLELGGIPVAYTPYLSHPDPTVKRKSGFLAPTPGMSSTLGPNITVPYFWAMSDNQDMTFSPRFLFPKSNATRAPSVDNADRSILQRVVLAGEHRWAGSEGATKTVASLTADKHTGDLRGHIDAKGRFDLNETWRAGYKVERSTDDTYTSLYSYPIAGDRPWMTTRPYVEGFRGNNYAMVEGFAFQGLRSKDDPGRSPVVLPHAIYSYVGSPGDKGGYWTMDADSLAYARGQGTDAGRLVTQVAWNRPYISPLGDVYKLTTSFRADGYQANDVAGASSPTSGRAVPQVALNWRFPFLGGPRSLPQVIEPLAMVAASPNGGNPTSIPNEDSIDFELDEINVLRPNRLPGLDRVEGGMRGAYGLRWSAYPPRGGYINAQMAQGWHAHPDSAFQPESGFAEELSDYVGRVDYLPSGNLAFLNRVRLDKNNYEMQRQESTVSVGPPLLALSATYLMLQRSAAEIGYPRRQYLVYTVSSAISQYWQLMASASQDLTDSGGQLGWRAQAVYSDECFAFVTDFRRTFTHDRDLTSGYELTFNVVFKTLANVPVNAF